MKTPPESIPVPMLDVKRQNAPLQAEIEEALIEVARSGAYVHGPACLEFESAMASYCQVDFAVGCASGSDALLLPLMAHDIGPGDEVIIPSFTFFATAGAVWRLGATPVFADICPDTFNIDPEDVGRKISAATKAIIPVHLFGQSAPMDALQQIAQAHRLFVVEDAAQAIGAEYCGRPVGGLGNVGAFSFYPTKNLGGMGDGGMMTTNDEELAAKLRHLRDHGQHPRYHHQIVGVNSRLDTMQAAILKTKLAHVDRWASGRRAHAARYEREFAESQLADRITAPVEASGCQSVWNQYTIRVLNGRRAELMELLQQQKIGAAIYYPIPLHLQECFASLGYQPGSLPHTEQACEEVLSLPVYGEMTDEEQSRVIEVIASFGTARRLAA